MGKNKDAAVGFIGIGIIIAVIVGVVVMLFPSEPETMQGEVETKATEQIGPTEERPTDLEEKLSPEEIQKIVAGFEAYNKSVKMLLDMCVNVETESDYRQLALLITEYGEDFLENAAWMIDAKNKLMAEGYGDHSVLGPLLSESSMLEDQMSFCMEVLAWEISG